MSIIENLLDKVGAGVPTLIRVLPADWKKRALARVQDFNPFRTISANQDLVRALRLAWIEVTLQVDAAVQPKTQPPDWAGLSDEIGSFSGVLVSKLKEIRSAAFDRNMDPGHSPIDAHLGEVLQYLPDHEREAVPGVGLGLTRGFASVLAELTAWPLAEVPSPYVQVGIGGLVTDGSTGARDFGELVFAAFADLIVSPNKYPEAGKAFELAMGSMGRELAMATLERVRGLDEKVDDLLAQVRTLSGNEPGFAEYLNRVDEQWAARWVVLSRQVDRFETKIDTQGAVIAEGFKANQAAFEKVVAALQVQGRVGKSDGQVAEKLVLELVQRLKPEVLNFNHALKELNNVVDVALQVISEGKVFPEGHDKFVDEVMFRVSEQTAIGELQVAATLIDDALVQLDRRDEMEREAQGRRRERLLAASLRQHMLLRDVERVADTVFAMAALSEPTNPAGSQLFLANLQNFYDEGSDRGIDFSMKVAIELARRWTVVSKLSDERGKALGWLGNALQTLGERESDTRLLEEAVQAYRDALLERTRERVPLLWATTQHNLGSALATLGQRESGTQKLEEALQAHRNALEERTRERVPLQWAMTQNNLGIALSTLGARESGTQRLEEAVQTFRDAAEEFTRECVPLHWAATKNNLGNALSTLGQRESGSKRLEEAVLAYRDALMERIHERVPLLWAGTQNNLGNALQTLGERGSGMQQLEEAVQAYRYALEEYTRERVPLLWATTQNDLGNALKTLGERESGAQRLKEAVLACHDALKERTRERVPLQWAMTQNNLGNALNALGQRESGTQRLEEAVQAYRNALEEYTRERVPMQWAMVQNNLGSAHAAIGERESGTQRLEEAIQTYRDALEEYTRQRVPLLWAGTQNNLGSALQTLGERESGTRRLEEAVQAYRNSLAEYTNEVWPERHHAVAARLALAVQLLEKRRGDG